MLQYGDDVTVLSRGDRHKENNTQKETSPGLPRSHAPHKLHAVDLNVVRQNLRVLIATR